MDGPACFQGVKGRKEVARGWGWGWGGLYGTLMLTIGKTLPWGEKKIITCRVKREEILFNVEQVGPLRRKKRWSGLGKELPSSQWFEGC